MEHLARYKSWKERIILYSKGVAMGVADAIPGVSGGTIALISGIYEHLILAISSVRVHHAWTVPQIVLPSRRKEALSDLLSIHWSFLIPLLAGIATGLLSVAGIMPILIRDYPFYTFSFFFGLILFSVWIPFRAMEKRPREILLLLLFAGLTFYVVGLDQYFSGSTALPYVFFSGAVAICAMILPGISGAYILVLLGEYDLILSALHEREFTIILVFIAGLLTGILSFIQLLKILLDRYHSLTMAALTGILVGSLRKLWPFDYIQENQVIPYAPLVALGLIVAGSLTIMVMEWLSIRLKDPEPPY
ncbi:MAG: DUF368 domain-containing protein [Spirochaetales bacterium]|nr:DUF368 domain-containing protein [Spirochaetales bacterium]